jgi:hypothetical protein
LHVGTNNTDKPMIKIINYDFINPSTTITLSFAGIQSLAGNLSNTISIGVKMYYNDAMNSSTYLYILTPKLPQPTTTAVIVYPGSGWSWSFNVAYTGANVVLSPTGFILYLNIPWSANYSGYNYASTGAQDQFILIKIYPKFLIDPYNKVNITSSDCSEI